MVETLKRHLAVLVAIVLAWGGYAYLDEGDAKKTAAAKSAAEEIPERFLELNDADATWARVVDPYRFEVPGLPSGAATPGTAEAAGADAPAGRTPAEPAVSAASPSIPHGVDLRAALTTALDAAGTQGARLRAAAERTLTAAVRAARLHAADVQRDRARFSLVLESTLAAGDAGQARISGRTVLVGDAMPQLDPEHPPVLESVAGSMAIVVHMKNRYVLDLDGMRRIDVGGPPPGAIRETASTVGARTTGPAPAAAPEVPKKTSGGVRIRGSNKSKRP